MGLFVLLVLAATASAVIQTPLPIQQLAEQSQYVFVAKIDSVDAAKPALIASVQTDLKGKVDVRRLPVVLTGIADAKNPGHIPNLTKRLVAGGSTVWFVLPPRGKRLTARVFSEGTWMSVSGTKVEDRIVWILDNGEPFLRRSFKGTSAELEKAVHDGLGKKAPFPAFNDKEESGYGPEVAKSSRLPTLLRPFTFASRPGPGLFAVIPTLGIGGPIAILALLFPTVFGGVLILFRQWAAFIMMFSVNSMLFLIYVWKGRAWMQGTWLGSDAGIWFAMTLVVLLCTIWAWRRQLRNLALGADALDTPSRTEILVLAILTATCTGFLAYLWIAGAPNVRDLPWDMTLALAGGVAVGFVYKLFRSVFEVMIPMATEGVMLGSMAVVHLVVLAMLGGNAQESAVALGGGDHKFELQSKWEFVTPDTERGFFVSAPVIFGNKVLAANSIPVQKAGGLYCIDLTTGKSDWNFIDDGDFKQVFSTPVVADGRIFIGEGFHEDPNCKVYCLDAKSPTKIWEYKTTSQTESSPIVADNRVFIGCGNDGFFCFDGKSEKTGKVLWQFPEKGYSGRLLRFGAPGSYESGKIYVGTGVDRLHKDDPGETAVFCLDAVTGKQVWNVPMPLPVWGAPVMSTAKLFVTVGNGDVFSDAERPAGAVYCLDPETGNTFWHRDLPNGVLQKPAVGANSVFVGCRDGSVTAFDRASGEIRWKINLGSPVLASPTLVRAAAGPCLYALSSTGTLALIDPNTGKTLGTSQFQGKDLFFNTPPAVAFRDDNGVEVRTLVVATGDKNGSAPARLLCLEDRTPIK
jgi:outer membrane protein assembly factor BamB